MRSVGYVEPSVAFNIFIFALFCQQMPKGSDESWVGKLIEKCSKYKHFDKPRFGTSCEYYTDCFAFVETNPVGIMLQRFSSNTFPIRSNTTRLVFWRKIETPSRRNW